MTPLRRHLSAIWSLRIRPAAAHASDKSATQTDEQEVRIKVDDTLHVVIRRHLFAQRPRVVAYPRKDEGRHDGASDVVCGGGVAGERHPVDNRRADDVQEPTDRARSGESPQHGVVVLVPTLDRRKEKEEEDTPGELKHDDKQGVGLEVRAREVGHGDKESEDHGPQDGEDEVPGVPVFDNGEARDPGGNANHQRKRLYGLRLEDSVDRVRRTPAEDDGNAKREDELEEEQHEHLPPERCLDPDGELAHRPEHGRAEDSTGAQLSRYGLDWLRLGGLTIRVE